MINSLFELAQGVGDLAIASLILDTARGEPPVGVDVDEEEGFIEFDGVIYSIEADKAELLDVFRRIALANGAYDVNTPCVDGRRGSTPFAFSDVHNRGFFSPISCDLEFIDLDEAVPLLSWKDLSSCDKHSLMTEYSKTMQRKLMLSDAETELLRAFLIELVKSNVLTQAVVKFDGKEVVAIDELYWRPQERRFEFIMKEKQKQTQNRSAKAKLSKKVDTKKLWQNYSREISLRKI